MRLRRVIWNPWQSNGKLRNMKNQSFEVLCHKQIRNARRGSKEKPTWSILDDNHFSHFWSILKSNLCMLYFVSNIRKSVIKCFKRCTIQSWNEGVTAVGSQTPQAESQLRNTAKSAFCCEMISQLFFCVCEILQTSFSHAKWSLALPDICDRHFWILFFRYFCINFHSSPCSPPTIRFLS